MAYELHLNLRQRAALKVAMLILKEKKVQKRITEFLQSCDQFAIYKVKEKWHKLIKVVVEEWNKDFLPPILEAELIHVVKMIGDTILNWFQYIKHRYGAEEGKNGIDKIHWTPYGTINAVKIFKSSWLDNPKFDITKLYDFACSYAMEDYINNLWNKIPIAMQDVCHININQHFNQHILAYWKYCRDDDLPNIIKHFQDAVNNNELDMHEFYLIYDLNLSVQENMARLSVHQGNSDSMKYFWAKLTKEERNRSVLTCARMTVKRFHDYQYKNEWAGEYKQEKYVEICIFLLTQMSTDDKKSFFNEKLGLDDLDYLNTLDVKDEILSMLLSTWPWQDLFIPVLKDMLQYQDDDSEMPCIFLDTITKRMSDDHELGYSVETSKYRSLLREVWLILPASIKQKISREYTRNCFIENLIKVWDMDSLKLILNHSKIAAVRDRFIGFGRELYYEFIEEDQFEKLDQLIKEICRSEEEKKQFKQQIDFWERLLNNGRFDLADKLLDWRCNTPEERQSFKTNINDIKICENLFKVGRDDLIHEFLNWKFDTEDEKKRCKDHFKDDLVVYRLMCEIWANCERDMTKAINNCNKIIELIYGSKEEIELYKKRTSKKEFASKLETDQFIWKHIVSIDRELMIDEFLFWFSGEEFFNYLQGLKQKAYEVLMDTEKRR